MICPRCQRFHGLPMPLCRPCESVLRLQSRYNVFVRALLYIGLIRVNALDEIRWPIYICNWTTWVVLWRSRDFFGVFRNRDGIVKWESGRLLPRRWGFHILGLEIGDRG